MVVELHNRKKLEDSEDDDDELGSDSLRRQAGADVITIKKSTLFWVLTSLVGLVYFYHAHLHPRPELLRLFELTTHRRCNATLQYPQHPLEPFSPHPHSLESVEFDPPYSSSPHAVNTHCRRLPTKVRMTDPTLLLLSYPVSHVLVEHVGMKNFPRLITPNLISFLNPVVALVGAYFVMTATARHPRHSGRPKSTSIDGKQSLSLEDAAVGGAPGAASASLGDPRMRIPFCDDTYISVVMNDTADDGDSFPKICFPNRDVSIARLRIAAFFMWLRACLDTMDGVLARAQVESGIITPTDGSFRLLGLLVVDGAAVDVVTDFVGVFIFMAAIVLHLWSRKVLVTYGRVSSSSGIGSGSGMMSLVNIKAWYHRLLAALYAKLSPLLVARLIPVSACVMIAIRGVFWEHYVPVFSQYFDYTSSPELLKMERSFQVQLVYFLWGISCADVLLTYVVVALAFNLHWAVMKAYASWGWLWTLALVILSSHASSSVMAAVAAEPKV